MLRWTEPLFLPDEAATEGAGRALARALAPGDRLGLIGDLGAGKTCLTRGLLDGLYEGLARPAEARVSSPTYALVNLYPSPLGQVAHFDLYRLRDLDDLESTGYWDLLAEAGLAIIEWIDQIDGAWPPEALALRLAHAPGGRALSLSWVGVDAARGEARLARAEAALRGVS